MKVIYWILMGLGKHCYHPQSPTITHNHPQSPTIKHNHPGNDAPSLTTTHNYPQLSKIQNKGINEPIATRTKQYYYQTNYYTFNSQH